jgi:hypothetical protein
MYSQKNMFFLVKRSANSKSQLTLIAIIPDYLEVWKFS